MSAFRQRLERHANLMAAAPEMLEALEELLHLVTHGATKHGLVEPTLQRARAAIAKAKGEQQ